MHTFSRMSALLFRVPTVLALMALSGAALASPTLVGTTSDPLGIDNLIIDGTNYDVAFSTTSFDSTFAFGTTAGINAGLAITGALNSLGVTELGNEAGDNFHGVLIEDDLSPLTADCAFFYAPGPPWLEGNCAGFELGQGGVAPFEYFTDAAIFSLASAAVPEPSTLVLLGLGLVGVWLSRRRLAH